MAAYGNNGPEWVAAKNGELPAGAVAAGKFNNEETYVARFKADDGDLWVPGQLFVSKQTCIGVWKGRILKMSKYEVLCNCRPEWKKVSREVEIPRKSLEFNDSDSKVYFIGRVCIQDDTYIGSVSEENEKLFAHANNFKTIYDYKEYEILTVSQSDQEELKRKDKKGMMETITNKVTKYANGILGQPEQKVSLWVWARDGEVPAGAVAGGENHLGKVYLARISLLHHQGQCSDVLPGKLIPKYQKCFVSLEGKEVSARDYQVLCNVKVRWEKARTGDAVPRSIFKCPEFHGTQIGIGRVQLGRTAIVPGKVVIKKGKLGKCYILRDKKEEGHENFELLISEQYAGTQRSESDVTDEDASSVSGKHRKSKESDSEDERDKHSRQGGRTKNRTLDNEDDDFYNKNSLSRPRQTRHASLENTASPTDFPRRNSHTPRDTSLVESQLGRLQRLSATTNKYSAQKKGSGAKHSGSIQSKSQTSSAFKHNYDKYSTWIEARDGDHPSNAVVGGRNYLGPIYVARLRYNNEVLPGKLIPTYKYCYSTSNGKEVRSAHYEVLCEKNVRWVAMTADDDLPSNVLLAGSTYNSKPLYVGRVIITGSTFIGKVQASDKCCYITKQQEEVRCKKYEILVEDSSGATSHGDVTTVGQASAYLTSVVQHSQKPPMFKLAKSQERDDRAVLTEGNAGTSMKQVSLDSLNTRVGSAADPQQDISLLKLAWVTQTEGIVPNGAVPIADGSHNSFLARAHHSNCLLPGLLIHKVGCFVDFNNQQYLCKQYEVLCVQDAAWIPVKVGEEVPATAIACGYSSYGENLYFGRVWISSNDSQFAVIGQVAEHRLKCTIFYNGETLYPEKFEILVQSTSAPVLQRTPRFAPLPPRTAQLNTQQQTTAPSPPISLIDFDTEIKAPLTAREDFNTGPQGYATTDDVPMETD